MNLAQNNERAIITEYTGDRISWVLFSTSRVHVLTLFFSTRYFYDSMKHYMHCKGELRYTACDGVGCRSARCVPMRADRNNRYSRLHVSVSVSGPCSFPMRSHSPSIMDGSKDVCIHRSPAVVATTETGNTSTNCPLLSPLEIGDCCCYCCCCCYYCFCRFTVIIVI